MRTKDSIYNKRTTLTICIVVMFLGCTTSEYSFNISIPKVEISNEQEKKSQQNIFMAGSSTIDITPNPGKALAGYSLLSGEAIGVRHHLYANILLLSPTIGDDLLYIQLDLFSGSRLLHSAIAETVGSELNMHPFQIVISGNHTHSGPGNFLENRFYNTTASSNSGFDKEYFTFLLDRISVGVLNAKENLFPAAASSGIVSLKEHTRNRSIEAYIANKEIVNSDNDKPNIFEAVNPEMRMMRIDRVTKEGDYIPLAAITNYSIHGTVLPATNRYYSSDVFTYISRELKWYIESQQDTEFTPLVMSMVHGDVSPAYAEGEQGYHEAERLGISIGNAAITLHTDLRETLSEKMTIEIKALNLDLLDSNNNEDFNISKRGYLGFPSAGGAEDGRNEFMRRFSFVKEGNPSSNESIEGQGHKRVILGKVQGMLFPAKQLPHQLMLQSIIINDVAYIPLPFEVTGMAGSRISQSLTGLYKDKFDINLSEVTVVSCSNGYFGYLTTEEEYNQQHYEGASNLYGPQTLSYLLFHLQGMSLEKSKSIKVSENFKLDYSPGPQLRQPYEVKRLSFSKNTQPKVTFKNVPDPGKESYWSFFWTGEAPELIDFTRSIIQMEKQEKDQNWNVYYQGYRRIDDLGYNISIELKGQDWKSKKYLYEARWYASPEIEGTFRFVVLDGKADEIERSDSFQL
jgi:neutral ceramidase